MQVVVAGGTGLLGSALVRALRADGHAVTVLTRNARHQGELAWNPDTPGDWCAAVTDADAVVNLAGTSIAGARWTRARKAAILESRVRATRALAQQIRGSRKRPVFVSGS